MFMLNCKHTARFCEEKTYNVVGTFAYFTKRQHIKYYSHNMGMIDEGKDLYVKTTHGL